MTSKNKKLLLCQAAVLPFAALMAAPVSAQAQAQDATQAEDSNDAGTRIVVTARKREETLLEAPLAITAFSEASIEEAGFAELEDIGLQTAGFQFSDQGGQQPGRYNTQLRFRGMSTAQFSPTFATGALFIDGVYVLNGGTSVNLVDVERVEAIKGPQAAYFGRNTFGGALNFITRDPSLTDVNGQIEASMTDRQTFDLSAIVEVPIIEDKMSFSLSGRFYDKRGHYVANDGGRLGNEQTSAINAVLYMEPTDNLSIKLRASYSEDSDGAPAAAYVSGFLNDTCSGTTITTGAGETAMPRNYICGQVPDIDTIENTTLDNPAAANFGGPRTENMGSVVSQNTMVTPFSLSFFNETPAPDGVPDIQRVGLERRTERYSAEIEYEFDSGYFLDFLGGINKQNASWIRDFDLADTIGWFSRDPQAIEDLSAELRFTSPQDQRFRWLIGANYYEQTFISSGAGGDATTGCFVVFETRDFDDCITSLTFPNGLGGSDESEVFGLFVGLEFDFTEQLTLSLEGRYQDDTLTKGGVVTPSGLAGGQNELNSKEFLPRAILSYQPTPDTNVYVSYARGVLQGDINDEFFNADERERAQYVAVLGDSVAESLPEEKLEAWEIGWKQELFDGRASFNLAGYYYQWSNIKGRSSAEINETCDEVKLGQTGCTFPGVMLGDPAQIDDGTGTLIPFFNSRNVLIPGDADLWGIEFEGQASITDRLQTQLNVTWAKNEYTDYQFNFVAPFAGFSQMEGNSQPRFPEWSGNFAATYTAPLTNDFDWFLRSDVIYFGEAFVDESNLAFTEDYFLVNARLGVQGDDLRFEIFARNLLDEDAWAAGARWTEFAKPTFFGSLTTFQGVAVTPQDRRQFGLRIIKDF